MKLDQLTSNLCQHLLLFFVIHLSMLIGLYFFTCIYMAIVFCQIVRISSILGIADLSEYLQINENMSRPQSHISSSSQQNEEWINEESEISIHISQQGSQLLSQQMQNQSINQDEFLWRLGIAFYFQIDSQDINIIGKIFLVLIGFFMLSQIVNWETYTILITVLLNLFTWVYSFHPISVFFMLRDYNDKNAVIMTILTLLCITTFYYLTESWLSNNIYGLIFVLALCHFSSIFYTNQIFSLILFILIYFIISLFIESISENWITRLNFPWKFVFFHYINGIVKQTSLPLLVVAYLSILEKTVRQYRIVLQDLHKETDWRQVLYKFIIPFFILTFFIRYYLIDDDRVYYFILLPVGLAWAIKITIFSDYFLQMLSQSDSESNYQSNSNE